MNDGALPRAKGAARIACVRGEQGMIKHYEVVVTLDGKKVHLNHFMQELTASSTVGLFTPLASMEGDWKRLSVSIERLPRAIEVSGRESK
jgi:hypothetical protein